MELLVTFQLKGNVIVVEGDRSIQQPAVANVELAISRTTDDPATLCATAGRTLKLEMDALFGQLKTHWATATAAAHKAIQCQLEAERKAKAEAEAKAKAEAAAKAEAEAEKEKQAKAETKK